MKKTFILVAWVLLTNQVFAQESKPDSLADRKIELPAALVQSARFNYLKENAASTFQKFDIQKQHLSQDLPYLFSHVSSVVLTSDAGTGTGYTGIRVRGSDLTRINVTMNGIPVNDPESHATYFVDMPDLLSSSNEVELTKGVGASKNGSANFGAGISIQNLDVNNPNPSLQFQSEAGSFNTFRQMIKIGSGLLQNHFNATLRLSSIQSDGYIKRSASDLQSMQFSAKYQWDASTQVNFNYVGGKEKTGQAWNGVAESQLVTDRTYNELGLRSDGTWYPNQTDNYQQQYYQLFADHKFNSRWSVGSAFFLTRGQGYYEEYKSDARYSNYLLAPVVHGSDTLWKTDLIRQLWLDNDFYGMRLYSHYVSAKTDAALYVNLNQYAGRHFGKVIWTQQGDVPDQYEWYRLTANKQDQNIYAMVDHRFRNRWSLYADLQYRHVNYQLNGFRNNPTLKHELEYHFMNPKLKLSFQDDIQLLSLLAGISQKEPNRDDVEAGAGSLPKAEKLLDIELNYSRSFWRQFMVHANVFYMMYQDQLVLNGKINDIGAYTRVNVDRSFRRGIEVELLWKAIPRWIDVSANVALSQNIIPGFVSYTDDYDQGIQIEKTYSNTPISFSPGLIASDKIQLYPFTFFYNSRFRPWAFVLQAKYVGKQYLDNTGSADRMLKAYSVFDMGVHCPIAWRGRTLLTLKATLYNFLNHLYEANGYTYGYIENQTLQTYNYYFPQAGRRWMLGVNLNL